MYYYGLLLLLLSNCLTRSVCPKGARYWRKESSVVNSVIVHNGKRDQMNERECCYFITHRVLLLLLLEVSYHHRQSSACAVPITKWTYLHCNSKYVR